MFCKKLKLKIKELEKQLAKKDDELLKKNSEISDLKRQVEKLNYQILHPAKYNESQKVGDFVITGRRCYSQNDVVFAIAINFFKIIAPCFFPHVKKDFKIDESIIKKGWEYDVVNIATGEKSKKTELELIAIETGLNFKS